MTEFDDDQFGGTDGEEDFEDDLTEIPEEGSKYKLPPGDYSATCEDVERHRSDKSGNLSWKWTFLVDGKITLYLYTSLAPKAAWRRAQVTKALGLGGAGTVVKFKPSDVRGRRVTVHLEDGEPYKGRVKSDITEVMPHPDGWKAKKEEAPF